MQIVAALYCAGYNNKKKKHMFSKESEFFWYFWFKLITFMYVEPTDMDNRLHHSN